MSADLRQRLEQLALRLRAAQFELGELELACLAVVRALTADEAKPKARRRAR